MSRMTRSEAGRLGGLKCKEIWVNRYEKQPKKCRQCKQDMPYEKRRNTYCDHSCAASFNNKRLGRRERKIPVLQICQNCNSEIKDSKHIRKYCSRNCAFSHQWETRKLGIESGQEKSVRVLKKYLLETRGVQCEICGEKNWCGQPIPLIMDHVDGNSEHNQLSNLRLVCGNCDMQLPTYKSKNIGNGRHVRKQRYAKGKSY